MSYSTGVSGSDISSWYQQYFGRAPQASEIRDWQSTGMTGSQVQQGLANHTLSIQGQADAKSNWGKGWGDWQAGDATQNDAGTIKGYYQKYLGRTPIDQEVNNWLGTNQTLGEIEKGLMDHPTASSNLQRNGQLPASPLPPLPPTQDIYSSASADGAAGASGFKTKKSSWKTSGQSTKGTNNLKLQIQGSTGNTGLNITG
jgi:hypothetical protein